MANPFAESPLPMNASLNRVVLAGLPPFAARFEGRTVWGVIYRAELECLVLAEFPKWKASPDPLTRLNDLPDDHPAIGRVALEIADRLAALLWVLHHGPPEARAERPEWNDEAWAFWRAIRGIALGGGQVAGKLGPRIIDRCIDLLDGAPEIRLAPARRLLPLLGCARRLPPVDGVALVLDTGGSTVKRGLACISEGRVVGLELLDTQSVPYGLDGESVVSTLNRMTEGFAQPVLPISVNCYVDASGTPVEDTFIGMLRHVTSDAPRFIADRISRFGKIELIHDGTAAALVCAGEPHTAVLTLGTSVGVGIPPASAEGLLPLDGELSGFPDG